MKKGDKVAIICCSNGQVPAYKGKLQKLQDTLTQIGLMPVWSEFIYARDGVFSGTASQRAGALMDFDVIGKSDKLFWGYSDLTTILNAIYTKAGKEAVLYQLRNLIYDDAKHQICNFSNSMLEQGNDLFDFAYQFVQKESMQGIVVGGNIRCLLKLAGTEYFPDVTGKILLLEAYGGEVPQMVTYCLYQRNRAWNQFESNCDWEGIGIINASKGI